MTMPKGRRQKSYLNSKTGTSTPFVGKISQSRGTGSILGDLTWNAMGSSWTELSTRNTRQWGNRGSTTEQESGHLSYLLALPLSLYMILGKELRLSGTQFPHFQNKEACAVTNFLFRPDVLHCYFWRWLKMIFPHNTLEFTSSYFMAQVSRESLRVWLLRKRKTHTLWFHSYVEFKMWHKVPIYRIDTDS